MGVGLAFLPALYVRSEIGNRGELKVMELEAANLYRQIGLAWRKGSRRVEEFELLGERLVEIFQPPV